MSRGYWSETDKPIRPGTYNRFKAAALARIKPGKHGIVALIAKSDWGAVGEITRIGGSNPELDLVEKMGRGGTAYRLGRLALLGGPKELLVYRVSDGNGKKASVTLKGKGEALDAEDAIKIETKYFSGMDFKVTVEKNPILEKSADLTLFIGQEKVYKAKFLKGKKSEIAEAINKDPLNTYLDVTVVGTDKEIALESTVAEPLKGGNSGTGAVQASEYLKALSAFETRQIDGLTLDGVTDPQIITSLWSWLRRNRRLGNKLRVYTGAPKGQSLQDSINMAKTLNNEGLVYVGTGGVLDGVEYTPAETAAYVMGAGEGIDLKECLCNYTTPFHDVVPKLTHEQIEDSIIGGVMALVYRDGTVKIEDDVNTYTEYSAEHNEIWGNLRAIRFIDMVDMDVSNHGNRYYVGKVLNGRNGQLAMLAGFRQYFEILQEGEIVEDFTVDVDEKFVVGADGKATKGNQALAASDEFYWKWEAKYINVTKKLFGTGIIR